MNLIRGKFQSFQNNGKTKINCLVSLKELEKINVLFDWNEYDEYIKKNK